MICTTRLNPRLTTAVVLASALALGSAHAQSQPFPNRPVRIVVPYAPGGATDSLARALGQHLAGVWSQGVVVDNRPGGNTVIGAQDVARANPDGYTLLLTAEATLVANPVLYKSLPYDPIKSFAPITALVGITQVLVTYPDFAARVVSDLIELAKQRPGQVSYGSFGTGSTGHLNMVMFEARTGIQLLHVPYKGAAPAMTDVMGGQVALLFGSIGLVGANITAGRLRAIAVGGLRRHPLLPDVPTLVESGLPEFEATSWFGLLAPSGTPVTVVAQVNAAVRKVFADQAFIQRHLVAQALEPMIDTPVAFAAFIVSEQRKWGRVIRASNVVLD